jgi:hypothetical protein
MAQICIFLCLFFFIILSISSTFGADTNNINEKDSQIYKVPEINKSEEFKKLLKGEQYEI